MTLHTDHQLRSEATTTEWMSPTEICKELDIPLQTFYQWRAKGIGPHAYRIGRHLRISRADFEDWLSLRSDP
ncbi:excisionase family DNA binding protein [Arthrobacter silviterrae]|uniref:Helix-turn-helix domain-containing protein n=1 Tax=Arthrobacter silviterrae TaxID=2026658 RepID=A0ABX0DAM4_9MICC|nr:helix-turn-helix domain-containing protein [Arthrobacter silviterrae]MDQ0278761.1 excisionase family DNA binding protein [Arthrobacter silviterrae]NGN83936.1 helix-turn-helix domain-containing protein [Arthrobacter silviterrae]